MMRLKYNKATDEENTEFIVIENYISVIDISDIVGKLPDPELKKYFKCVTYLLYLNRTFT